MRAGAAAVVVGLTLVGCPTPMEPGDGGPEQRDGEVLDAAGACAAGAEDGTACGTGKICVAGECATSMCGDGFVDTAFEDCEDGNDVAYDGCEPDTCEFTCHDDSDCDDGNVCTGAETCNAETHVCADAEDPDDGTDCNRIDPPGADGVCRAGTCAPPGCGNGAREGTEECDDGNTGGNDGCENDCTFTCAGDADCADGDACNGPETCDLSTHLCQPPAGPAADGTVCTSATIPSGICIDAGCVMAGCGNGFLEAPEECDDGNGMGTDGCETDCTFTCTVDVDCADTDPCDGAEICDVATHTCLPPTTPGADGTTCTTSTGGAGICLSAGCVMAGCGNTFIEPDEDCEDGNATDGDGCDSCQFSCEANADCADTDVCNGAELCDLTTHTCQPAPIAAEDGVDCSTDSTARICVDAVCVMGGCGNSYLETGEDCDDGNTNQTDGCKNDCTFTCVADADCSDGNQCDGSEACDLDAHTCSEGTPLSTGDSCTSATVPTGVCVGNACIDAGCGNGYTEPTEDCDDDNTIDGDGCDNDCTFSCSADADCDDSNVCTGAEMCNTTTHTCSNPPDVTCTPSDSCHTASCDPGLGCQDTLIDGDGDGHAPGSFTCSSDCNDGNAAIYVGAEELCDLLDNNCNGATDETSPTWYIDCDRDGFATDTTGAITTCTLPPAPSGCPGGTWTSLRPAGASTIDCDDGNAARDPGNTEIVGNEVDNDCDGAELCYRDGDNDNARSTTTIASADFDCDDLYEALSSAPVDCNDGNSTVRPGIPEVVGNGVDNDCSGGETCYRNTDGDSHRTNSTIASADADCVDAGEAYSSRPTNDCNDAVSSIHPGALELCDNVNQNCTGGLREGCPSATETYGLYSYSPTFGTTAGGSYESYTCPTGTVMIGIDAYEAGSYVNAWRAVCQVVEIDEVSATPEYTYTLRRSGAYTYGDLQGSTAGTTYVGLRCAADSVVTGLHVHADTTRLRSLQAYCGRVRWVRSGSSWNPATTATTATATAGLGYGTHYAHTCASGSVGRFISGYDNASNQMMSTRIACQALNDTPQ